MTEYRRVVGSGENMLITIFMILTLITSKSEQVCLDISSATKTGFYLENNLYTVTSATSMFDCAANCLSHTECLSFGFEPKTRSCHLHVENSITADLDLVTRAMWFHGDIDQWPKSLLGPCTVHHCNTGESCNVHRVTKQPSCVKVNAVLPPGYCPVPLSKLNADTSYEKQRTGSEANYTCNHGYLDVVRENVTAMATCLTDGTWSSVSLNCTGPYFRIETASVSTNVFKPIPAETLPDLTGTTETLIFLTKACKDSNFALHRLQDTSSDVIEIVIGGGGNQYAAIRDCIACNAKDIHYEADLLSCNEFRPFWLSWNNGIISVGKGHVVGDRTFMSWQLPSPFRINFVSVNSYKYNKGLWLFVRQA